MDLRIIFSPFLHNSHYLFSVGPQTTPMNKSWTSSLQDLGGSLTVGLSVHCNVIKSFLASYYELTSMSIFTMAKTCVYIRCTVHPPQLGSPIPVRVLSIPN